MDISTTLTMWSIVASIVSTLLAILAIGLSVYFFVIARRAESSIENSLTRIETQAEMIQKVTGRQLERLTKFITERNV